MRERRRKHDDLHRPLGGKGKRATKPRTKALATYRCPDCGATRPQHLCTVPTPPAATVFDWK